MSVNLSIALRNPDAPRSKYICATVYNQRPYRSESGQYVFVTNYRYSLSRGGDEQGMRTTVVIADNDGTDPRELFAQRNEGAHAP